eukprot:7957647-Pyramimonas_sp.AAC.1
MAGDTWRRFAGSLGRWTLSSAAARLMFQHPNTSLLGGGLVRPSSYPCAARPFMRHLRSRARAESCSSMNSSFGNANAARPAIAALHTKHNNITRCKLHGRCTCNTCPIKRHATRAPLPRLLSPARSTPSKLMSGPRTRTSR